MVENPPANARAAGDMGSIPGSKRSPGGVNGNPLQYSCLGNPMDREACRATVNLVCNNTHALKCIILNWWFSTRDDFDLPPDQGTSGNI